MGRQRRITWPEMGKSLKELCHQHNIDPGEELVKMLKETVEDEGGNRMPLFVKLMGPRDGYKTMVDILKFLSTGLRPVLRPVETHVSQTPVFNIQIKQFGALANGETKVVEVKAPTPRLITDESD